MRCEPRCGRRRPGIHLTAQTIAPQSGSVDDNGRAIPGFKRCWRLVADATPQTVPSRRVSSFSTRVIKGSPALLDFLD